MYSIFSKNRIQLALLTGLWSIPLALSAADIGDSLHISGFGTVSAAKSDSATPVLLHREITDDWCFDCDTTLGLQLDWLATSQLRTVVQVVKRPQDTFSSPELERALVEYAMNDHHLRVGRLRAPLFLMSQYYYVSSAYPWLRLPPEVYSNNLGITHYDGVAVDLTLYSGDDVHVALSPFYALPEEREFERYGQSYRLDTSRALGLATDIFYGDSQLHVSYLNTKASQIGGAISTKEYQVDLIALGISHYFGQLHFQGEAMFADQISSNWYAGLDYRFNQITPYIQYGQARRSKVSDSYLVGFRYDWTSSINTSIEWQHIQGSKNVINGQFTEAQNPANSIDSKVSIVSIGVSFTF